MEKLFKILDALFILSMVIYWYVKLFSGHQITENEFGIYILFLSIFFLSRIKLFADVKGLIL